MVTGTAVLAPAVAAITGLLDTAAGTESFAELAEVDGASVSATVELATIAGASVDDAADTGPVLLLV